MTTTEVHCTYLEDELMRVQFAHSQLVSDHPTAIGGGGTGPSPGEIVMMALTSASAIAGRRFADEAGLGVAHVGARASFNIRQEGFAGDLNDGTLSRLAYVGRYWRLLEVDGALSDSDEAALLRAMAQTGIARTLEAGVAIDEELVCRPTGRGRAPLPKKNPHYLTEGANELLDDGAVIEGTAADRWRVAATALDPATCLIEAGGSCSVAGADPRARRGPTSAELLLAGLAGCTTIYVARNAALLEIPVEAVNVVIRAEVPDDPAQPIHRIEKICTVTGDLTDNEVRRLAHIAKYCAIGQSMIRGAPITDQIAVHRLDAAAASGSPVAAMTREPPRPIDPDFCDDGACCVPAD